MAARAILSRLSIYAPRLNIYPSYTKPMNVIRTMSTSFTGRFAWKPIKPLFGLNRPSRVFIPGEEDIYNLPDPATKIWKEQRSLLKLDARGMRYKRKRPNPIDKKPQIKGIVLRTLIKKPKKPNSANRKCVLVRLSNGKEKTCFVPGIGHNLQDHSRVLILYKRVKDVPGLKLRVIRGVYDCSPLKSFN